MNRFTLAAGAALMTACTAHGGLIDPALDGAMRDVGPGETVSALVYLVDQVDLRTLSTQLDDERAKFGRRHEVVVRSLQAMASATQADLLLHLEAARGDGLVTEFQPFWITNVVRVEAVPDEIRALSDRPDVDRIYLNHPIERVAPVEEFEDAGPMPAGAIEPGVLAVRADEVWALGYDGTGVLVSHMDTGVDGNHPALASRWRGLHPLYLGNPQWAWFDPQFGDNSFPYEDSGNDHGTHTMGSVCGGAPGDQIGVAPGAQWICAGAIDRSGADIPTTVANAIEGFQWLADPDGNPSTSFDVPRTNSNSWGVATFHGYPDCDETFWSFLDGLEAVGCAVFFSAGNEGTSGLRRPADRASTDFNSLAVASVNANVSGWPISGFSSRGPTFCGPFGAIAVKPDISAPGESVRSSLPGGGYGTKSGTSMASPHVNGVAALILHANPDLSVEQVKQIIYDTAFDLGAAGEDNDYGWGMIDAYEAVQAALATVGLSFEFPNGRPQFVDPNGGTTIRVVVSGQSSAPEPGSGLLYYQVDGGGFISTSMTQVNPNEYDAVLPTFPCGANVDYYFSAETTDGEIAFNPFSAPSLFYSAQAYSGLQVGFDDDFEVEMGWTTVNEALDDGQWDRGVPAGGGDRGDPAQDADGSGQCWVTDNEDGNSDVDGGPTRLISPVIDITSLDDPIVSYARWLTNDDNDGDYMLCEISNDAGTTWVTLENVVGDTTGWITSSFLVADFVAPTSQMRLRFSVADQPNDSVTEAGIDAVSFTSLFCDDPSCGGDLDGNGSIGFGDILSLLAAWGCIGCPEDLDGGGAGFSDLLLLLANWEDCI